MTDTAWADLFDAQVRTHSALFFKLARGILRDGGDAETACQEAFLKVWAHRGAIRQVASLKALLAQAVVNESLQLLRGRKSQISAKATVAGSASGVQNDSVKAVDRRESVMLGVQTLPELQRTIVLLKYVQGMAGTQIADIVGCSAGEVSKQLARGLERLRILLVDWQFDLDE